nr:PREDICTED: uncharacterized protein LOC109033097 [Bemisia tabaci]
MNDQMEMDDEVAQQDCASMNDPMEMNDEVAHSDPLQTSPKCEDEPKNLCPLIQEEVDIFLSKLYGNPRITRKQVQEIINYSQNLLKGIGNVLKQPILELLQAAKSSPDLIFHWEDTLAFLEKPLEAVRSEHLRLKTFQEEGTYIEPIEITFGSNAGAVTAQGEHSVEMVTFTAHFIPLRQSLKIFLSQVEVMPIIVDFLKEIDDEEHIFSHYMNAQAWKTYKTSCQSKFVLPLFYYSDEFECGNALGSHKVIHKINGNYVCMPFLPFHLAYTFQNILMVYLHHSTDSKIFSNKKLYQCIIDEFRYLNEEGIYVNTPYFTGSVYFKLALYCGDNLGLHQMLGFVPGFMANFPCRFCKIHRDAMRQQCVDNFSLWRNRQNYDEDLAINDQSKTGISELCCFNEIPSFHCTESGGFDIFHDILEGCCVFSFEVIIMHLLEEKCFDLNTLNSRIEFFNYGSIDKDSKPPLISSDEGKIKISMSASEMFIFTKYFGLIIGDKVPEGHDVWALYILLRRIMDILMSPAISTDDIKILANLIQQHHELYLKLSPKKRLKNKMHHMIHYPRLIQLFGPPIYFWTMRFEAFYRLAKAIAYSISTNRNLTLSLAIRAQLVFHSFLKCHSCMDNRFDSGPSSSCKLSDVAGFDQIDNVAPSGGTIVQVVPWITVKGTTFKKGMVLVIGYENHLSDFAQIETIFLHNSKIAFVCTKMETINFDNHFYAFEVKVHRECCQYIELEKVVHTYPTVINPAAGKLFVTYKYGI